MTTPRDELVEVLPLSGFDQSLTYAVPLPFRGRLAIGSLVRIPLGRRQVMGIVTSLLPKVKPESSKLKFLITLAREEPVLTPDLVSLARWLADYYAAKQESVLETMIPAAVRDGAKEKTRRLIEINREIPEKEG
ncbi:MAG: primosomal protein N', partial [Opitutae bacterium]|nr:primosomal protein N' [Opitutae bacterium]